MKGQDNIIPHKFKPGQSGNPKGRPKGKSLTKILKELLQKETTIEIEGEKRTITNAELLSLKLMKKAIKGDDLAAIKEVFDRIEGKAKQSLEVEGEMKQIVWNEKKTYKKD